ncbi:MAG: hypothetical protein ABSB24_02840 [Gaiellaceae bacterium]|jgi:hypothetical protein
MADRDEEIVRLLRSIDSNTGYIDSSEIVAQLETTNRLLREILEVLQEREV